MQAAVLFVGPPGSGKSTQAEYVRERWGFVHLNTGEIVKDLIKQGEIPKTEYASGELTDSELVLPLITALLKQIPADEGIVMSGSPRTILEAFGDSSEQGLMQALEERCGKENIVTFHLDTPEAVSVFRNTHRLNRRKIDEPDLMHVRLAEYRKHTEPTIDALVDRGYKVYYIDGLPKKKQIADEIDSQLEYEFGKKPGTNR